MTVNSVAGGIPVRLKLPRGKSGLCFTATSRLTWWPSFKVLIYYLTNLCISGLDDNVESLKSFVALRRTPLQIDGGGRRRGAAEGLYRQWFGHHALEYRLPEEEFHEVGLEFKGSTWSDVVQLLFSKGSRMYNLESTH